MRNEKVTYDLIIKSRSKSMVDLFIPVGTSVLELEKNVRNFFEKNSNIEYVRFDYLDVPSIVINRKNAFEKGYVRQEYFERKKIRYSNLRTEEGAERWKRRELLNILGNLKFDFVDEQHQKNWVNSKRIDDSFETEIQEYSSYWAENMQRIMSESKLDVPEVAEVASKQLFPVSDSLYHHSAIRLMKYWKYGDEFKRWYMCMYPGFYSE